MSYVKAVDVLPEEILSLIQNYIDGEYIYIPRKDNNKKSWGENTNSKKEIHIRNSKIYEDYKCGMKVKELAEKCGFELFEKRTPIGHTQPNMKSDSYYYYRYYKN